MRDAGISEGMALVCAMHITAAVWINDDEPGLQADVLEWLDKVAPPSWHEPDGEVAEALLPNPGDYRHHRGGEDNGDAHLKNLLVHHQVIVPVTDGELDLGPWQQIFYCEFDGRRPEAARDQGARGIAVASSRVFVDGALEGRAAIVTGGGTNLGKASAAELARCGASVVIAGRRAEVLEQAAAEVGERCSWVAADIREPGGADRIVATALERYGRLDLVLNNAGGQYMVPAEGLATKGWRAVQRLNVDGTLAMCKAAYELALRDAGAGTIINVTVSPHHGMPAMAHTGAARAAVEAITRDLASAYGVHGISRHRGRARPLRHRVAPQVPGGALAHRRRHRARSSASAASRSTAGWSRCSPHRSGAALSGSVVTLDGGLDNWFGPWPPTGLANDGEVPTEERRPAA